MRLVDHTRRCRGCAVALVFAVVVAAQVAGASPQRLTLKIQVRDILEEPISGVEVRPDAGGTGGPAVRDVSVLALLIVVVIDVRLLG